MDVLLLVFLMLCTILGFNCHKYPPASSYPSSQDVDKVVYLNKVTNELEIEDRRESSPRKPKPIAHVTFKNKINATGWAFLKIRTDDFYADHIQARAAGYAEGYVTNHLIAIMYHNMFNGICNGDPSFCDRLKKFIALNRHWISEQLKKSYKDPLVKAYWHNVDLVYHQADGIMEGYRKNPSSTPLSDLDFHLMLLFGDEGDLESVLGKEIISRRARLGHCSALIKALPDHSDLFVSHTTWVDYKAMLRIMKHYDFKFHVTDNKGSAFVASEIMAFSSYPGSIASTDDYNMMSSGLVSLETSLITFKEDFLKEVVAQNIFEWVRSVVANRLAYSGSEWTHLFSMHNSGTYNNQWMVVDYNRFTPGQDVQSNTLWIIEQLPGVVEMADVSHVLRKQGYWASFNMPYFTLIYNMSGYPEFYEKFYPMTNYVEHPRARMFHRGQKDIHDMPSFFKLMRYNNFQHDPLSRCNCTPPYTSFFAIAARSDLNDKNGVYPNDFFGYISQGATDCKATSHERIKNLEAVAISSPTYDQQPPFQWSKTEWQRPLGHPDLWKFETLETDWGNM